MLTVVGEQVDTLDMCVIYQSLHVSTVGCVSSPCFGVMACFCCMSSAPATPAVLPCYVWKRLLPSPGEPKRVNKVL